MNRKEFLKMSALLGISLPFQVNLSSCNKKDKSIDPNEEIIIIGAGAGGLTAGYLLNQQGIEFQILEASSSYGGRMKTINDFADFPIPLGSEWLHVERSVLDEVVNDSSIQVDIETTPYNPDEDFGILNGQQITIEDLELTVDQKFIGSSWLDFYRTYVLPSVESKIKYNHVVESIDYSGDQIMVSTSDETFTATKVIISVPVKILQNETILFTPELPNDKREAISSVRVWDGFKAFIEFSEKFYPAFVAFETVPETAGEKLYYDASYGQNTTQNILGLFSVGIDAQTYIQLQEEDRINYILEELDEVFNGQASTNYIKHVFQNWNAEPHINGAYVVSHEDWRKVRTLGESVDDKLFFAGTSYTDGEDWSSVHTAARSALSAIEELAG